MTKYFYQDKEVNVHNFINVKKYWAFNYDLSKAYLLDVDKINKEHSYISHAKNFNIIIPIYEFFHSIKDYEKLYQKPIDSRIFKQYHLRYIKYSDNIYHTKTWAGSSISVALENNVYMKTDDQIIFLLGTSSNHRDPIPGYPLYNITSKTFYDNINLLYNK